MRSGAVRQAWLSPVCPLDRGFAILRKFPSGSDSKKTDEFYSGTCTWEPMGYSNSKILCAEEDILLLMLHCIPFFNKVTS